jgi:hypothetical protein
VRDTRKRRGVIREERSCIVKGGSVVESLAVVSSGKEQFIHVNRENVWMRRGWRLVVR